MSRVLKRKELVGIRLATNYGGWMYCDKCNENIGYLCYTTYDKLKFSYTCNCGNCGSALLDFEDSQVGTSCKKELVTNKNRFCCPNDSSPLITILDRKIKSYEMKITCKSCNSVFQKEIIN